jgi:hypothetical protein
MANGGRRPGAGRKPGVRSKLNQALDAGFKLKGKSPLEILMEIAQRETEDSETRVKAASAAAPYIHRKLPEALELSGDVAVTGFVIEYAGIPGMALDESHD